MLICGEDLGMVPKTRSRGNATVGDFKFGNPAYAEG